jgi:hypothetical protein
MALDKKLFNPSISLKAGQNKKGGSLRKRDFLPDIATVSQWI